MSPGGLVGPLYPVNLSVAGRPVLVVGAGPVATSKAAGLVESGAVVHVVAPEVSADMAALAGVTISRRPYRSTDLDGCWLVITATDDPAVNARVAAEADAAHLWVNSADDPANCSFSLPARFRRGDVLVAVSTGGRSPALASWLKRRLEADVGPEFAALADILAEERAAIRSSGRSTEGLDWRSALESGILDLVRDGRITEAKERLSECLSSSSD